MASCEVTVLWMHITTCLILVVCGVLCASATSSEGFLVICVLTVKNVVWVQLIDYRTNVNRAASFPAGV